MCGRKGEVAEKGWAEGRRHTECFITVIQGPNMSEY
jgi:hypothetical protein